MASPPHMISISPPPTLEDIQQHPRTFAAWRVLCINAAREHGAPSDNHAVLQHLQEFAHQRGTKQDIPTEHNDALNFKQLVSLLNNMDTPDPNTCTALMAHDASLNLTPSTIARRPVGVSDVRIEVVYCGICHTDLDCLTGVWAAGAWFPQTAGHEIIGIITAVGSEVSNLSIGQAAGLGFMCRTCGSCECCSQQQDQFCARRVYTFNARDWDGQVTAGGFSTHIVVNARCVLTIPQQLPLPSAAPLLCAGITTYSAIKHFGVAETPGAHVGVVGLGGLGHLAVRILKALGARVTVVSQSASKRANAMESLGADDFVLSSSPGELRGLHGRLTAIIDTVSGQHDVAALLPLLRIDGTLVLLGIPDTIMLRPFDILPRRLSVAGRCVGGGCGAVLWERGGGSCNQGSPLHSVIGSVAETQELLDLAAAHGITASVEVVEAGAINHALERLATNTMGGAKRFVVNMLSL